MAFALAVAGFAAAPGILAVDDPAWTTFQGDAGHTGFIDRYLSSAPARVLWSRPVLGGAITGVAIGSGLVFVTASDPLMLESSLVALDLASGSEQWRKTYPGTYSIGDPAYDPALQRVFVQTNMFPFVFAFLRAYAAHDGAFHWRAELAIQTQSSRAPVVAGGKVFTQAGYYGGIYAFVADSGEFRWYTQLPQVVGWSPTAAGNNTLLAYTDRLDVLDQDTGANVATIGDPGFENFGRSDRSPIVTRDGLAVISNGANLKALNLATLVPVWQVSLGSPGQASYDGSELLLTANGRLQSRNPATGALNWSLGPAGFRDEVIVFRGHVIARSEDSIHIVRRDTLAQEFTWSPAGTLAYGDDTLIVGGPDGVVTAISLGSSALLIDGFE